MTDQRVQLWIHVGLPKTGTSAIQAAFRESREPLRAAGITYPETGELGGGHARLAWPLLPADRRSKADILERLDADACRELWAALADELRNTGCPMAFISTEYFSEVAPSDLEAMSSLVSEDVRILIYLRRQDELMESGYNQAVKAGLISDRFGRVEYFAQYDYWHVLEQWAAVFGRSRIVPRVYDRTTAREGVVFDVAKVAGFDAGVLRSAATVSNLSLHPSLVEFQRVANAVGASNRDLVGLLQERIAALQSGNVRSYLSSDEREAILALYADSNARVAREYFNREDGALFAPPQPAESGAPPDPTNEVLAAAMALLWENLTTELADLRSEVLDLRDRLGQSPLP